MLAGALSDGVLKPICFGGKGNGRTGPADNAIGDFTETFEEQEACGDGVRTELDLLLHFLLTGISSSSSIICGDGLLLLLSGDTSLLFIPTIESILNPIFGFVVNDDSSDTGNPMVAYAIGNILNCPQLTITLSFKLINSSPEKPLITHH